MRSSFIRNMRESYKDTYIHKKPNSSRLNWNEQSLSKNHCTIFLYSRRNNESLKLALKAIFSNISHLLSEWWTNKQGTHDFIWQYWFDLSTEMSIANGSWFLFLYTGLMMIRFISDVVASDSGYMDIPRTFHFFCYSRPWKNPILSWYWFNFCTNSSNFC